MFNNLDFAVLLSGAVADKALFFLCDLFMLSVFFADFCSFNWFESWHSAIGMGALGIIKKISWSKLCTTTLYQPRL